MWKFGREERQGKNKIYYGIYHHGMEEHLYHNSLAVHQIEGCAQIWPPTQHNMGFKKSSLSKILFIINALYYFPLTSTPLYSSVFCGSVGRLCTVCLLSYCCFKCSHQLFQTLFVRTSSLLPVSSTSSATSLSSSLGNIVTSSEMFGVCFVCYWHN